MTLRDHRTLSSPRRIRPEPHASTYGESRKHLFILSFQHRYSLITRLLGLKNRLPNPEEGRYIAALKGAIYDGFERALNLGINTADTALLVDEEFGEIIQQDAKVRNRILFHPVNKPGVLNFELQHGDSFKSNILAVGPEFIRAKICHNVESDLLERRRATLELARATQFCKKQGVKVFIELVVNPTAIQMALAGGDVRTFMKKLRPQLVAKSIKELHECGIEADVWGVQTFYDVESGKMIVQQATCNGRDSVSVVISNHDESADDMKACFKVAAKIPGFVGFVAGKAVCWKPWSAIVLGTKSREEAEVMLAEEYVRMCKAWTDSESYYQ